ncbi:MAG: PD-(D/E)XK nuclease family protein [Candidatus Cloacimonetes bacterium]|nr:PD-(D/E)XK nuclease family protein [Candidatus Cloacimonadota bacterium]
MEFIKIGFNDDLLETALHTAGDDALLIFPTRSAAGYAQSRFYDAWDWRELQFLAMEDFEAAAIMADAPVLSEEKRLICLYLVLSDEDKETLHIMSYGDIVQWGKRFFDFFGELAEECLDADELLTLLDKGPFNLQEWQQLYLERILAIRRNYQSYILSLGFTDRIFYLNPRSFVCPWQDKEIVFVNQYYYNALHKDLLLFLEKAGNRISLIYQGLELKQQDGDWKVKDFDLAKAWAELEQKPRLRLIECENEDQMALAYLSALEKGDLDGGTGVIIDSQFHRKSYSRYFDPKLFRHPCSYPISETQLYQVIASLAEGLKAMQSRSGYLPMNLLARLISNKSFVRYFAGRDDEDTLLKLRSQLQMPLKNDYLYLDEAYLSTLGDCVLKRCLLNYLKHLEAFGQVNSIAELCQLLDAPEGLAIASLIDAEEAINTTVLKSFWEQVASFRAIESLGLIKDWAAIFPPEALALNLIELFLEYLKASKLSYQMLQPLSPVWDISNLLDTRNRSYSQVVFFQMIEGMVPAAPTPVWLFSEAQRKRLGMKNYDDIRAWERYYFYRLLLTSGTALCFSYRNEERDITPSSFLGELLFVLSESGEDLLPEKSTLNIGDIYASRTDKNIPTPLSAMCKEPLCCMDTNPPQSFFVLPCDPEQDFGEAAMLQSSVSGILQFIRNPFVWYLENRSKIYATPYEAQETIGAKLFGNIMHDYFALILNRYKGHNQNEQQLDILFGDQQALQNELLMIIREGKFRYQIPKNYNGEFLAEFISLRLAESLQVFYDSWLRHKIYRKSFQLIPESVEARWADDPSKCLGEVIHAARPYSIRVKGRADLRIEMDNEALIIDFKTGGKDINQLILYEWLYYLLDGLIPEENISSVFWMILDAEPSKEKISPDKRQALLAKILETLSTSLAMGYLQGQKATDRQRLKSITRADLYQPIKEAKDA